MCHKQTTFRDRNVLSEIIVLTPKTKPKWKCDTGPPTMELNIRKSGLGVNTPGNSQTFCPDDVFEHQSASGYKTED